MTKIAPNFTPPSTHVRSAVEQPVTQQARPEVIQAAYTSPDEFMAGESPLGNGLSLEQLGGAPSTTAPGVLSPALEPFREALDNIARQVTPDLLTNPVKLGQFIFDAVKELGVAGRDFMDAVGYIRDQLLAYNTGKDRVAQVKVPAEITA